MKKNILLSRDVFRESTFERDKHKCVICGAKAQDAHHIIERRLWDDGGYYIDNGASLCGEHHIMAEQTTLSVEEIREKAGWDVEYDSPGWNEEGVEVFKFTKKTKR